MTNMQLGRFKTRVEVHDLGTLDPAWRGIYSPLYDEGLVTHFIHQEFLENSGTYVQRYQNLEHWKNLLRAAQPYLPFRAEDELKIIDIGSGSGNTVFPLMDAYPNAQIVASDLSLPLLKALKSYHEDHYASRVCHILQLNAEDIIFESESIDFVVGGAVLHHLFDPRKALAETYRVLKPGGAAVFFEPFELGNQIIAILFEQLAALNELHPAPAPRSRAARLWRRFLSTTPPETAQGAAISPGIVNFFRAWAGDVKTRQGSDKSGSVFQRMEDKWLFTREYFEEARSSIGFKGLRLFPLQDASSHLFLDQINVYLRLALGTSTSALPQWAIDWIGSIDAHFSRESRRDLMIEAGIVLTK